VPDYDLEEEEDSLTFFQFSPLPSEDFSLEDHVIFEDIFLKDLVLLPLPLRHV
jgi:hypothetical protein